jgi:four helix bundle protein
MVIQSFRDIIAWQKSHELTLKVYDLTFRFPKHELFGLVSQMRRCSVSVPSNIAEGYKRKGKNDSIHFYVIAESSLEELRCQLFLSKDLKYITEEECSSAEMLSENVAKILHGWKINQK